MEAPTPIAVQAEGNKIFHSSTLSGAGGGGWFLGVCQKARTKSWSSRGFNVSLLNQMELKVFGMVLQSYGTRTTFFFIFYKKELLGKGNIRVAKSWTQLKRLSMHT